MIDPISNTSTVVGSTITLSCTSRGSPPNTFSWIKDGNPIMQSTSITTVTHTNSNAVFRTDYTIDGVTINDSGTYTCTVANPIGSDSGIITVTVLGMEFLFAIITN